MDALKTLRDDGAHAEQIGALGRPVARRAGTIFFAGKHYQRHVLGMVFHRSVIDGHLFSVREVPRDAALDAGHHLVLDADIGESAAHHHLVIAAPCAILVEIRRADLMRDQILPGGTRLTD